MKFEFESSKENLLQTILKNRENLDANTIAEAIKNFVRNHERYDFEKKRLLDFISDI
ncbi:MAG: hypothetical protein ACE5GR_02100 [Nitrosopumilus sp.]